jgi:hypothetical protein
VLSVSETEVLFQGNNLSQFMVNWIINPF